MAEQPKKPDNDKIDIEQMNALVNQATQVLVSAMRSKHVTPRERRDIARDLVKKAMPSGINLKHEAGDSFLNLVKQVHSDEKKKATKKCTEAKKIKKA